MLSFRLKKKLSHFTLDIEYEMENEILVLFGPSGSGKTTVLDCLAGLQDPDEGWVKLDGKTFYNGTSNSIRTQQRKVGYLFQDYALFPHMSVERNIYYGIDRKRRREPLPLIESLIEGLGIHHLLQKYPHHISGGEKQRVALARALATEPSILLLDEPLSALDHDTRLQCQEELLRIHERWKIPFIIVTHDRTEAEKLADRILFVEKGRVIDRS
ncbi:ATP-binding cassette domain-containing protein [Ammoniphilus sp. 3BR4]|uniref:ATP-binding cassette domain-containing protein n=1 Tax=Ammoniphilus sp. 3BR4 TaxID=3158265 RepID=UPI003465FFD4